MFGNKNKGAVLAKSRIIFEKIADDDQRAAELVEELRVSNPLCINFKMVAFLSGAAYALEGEAILIKSNVYLFAKKVDFLDGSLKEFIERTKETN